MYAAVPGVGQKPLRDAVKLLLDEYDEPDPLPRTLVERCGLMDRLDALRGRISRRILTGWRRLGSGWPTRSCCSFQAGVAGAAGSAGARSRWRFRMHG